MDCGVYIIRCVKNGSYYIGRSFQIAKRWYAHERALERGIHANRILQRTYDKYGIDTFEFEILEECEDKEDLIRLEQEWIDICFKDPQCMNLASSSLGGASFGRKLSDETKRKIGLGHLGKSRNFVPTTQYIQKQIERTKNLWQDPEYRQKVTDARKKSGYVVTEEMRQKMSKQRKGRVLSEEWKRKLGDSQRGKSKDFTEEGRKNMRDTKIKSTLIKNLITGEEIVVLSRQLAADHVGCSLDVVKRCLREPEWSPKFFPHIRFYNYVKEN